MQRVQQTNPTIWRPPTEGVLKVNIDASFFSCDYSTGFAIIIWNHPGQVMAAEMEHLENIASVDEVVAFSVLEGLRLAMDYGIFLIQRETYLLCIFNLLNREDEDLSDTRSIIHL